MNKNQVKMLILRLNGEYLIKQITTDKK